MSGEVVPEERRLNSQNILREMHNRLEGIEDITTMCALFDMVGSRILQSDKVHGVDLLLQQVMNILRKPGRIEVQA